MSAAGVERPVRMLFFDVEKPHVGVMVVFERGGAVPNAELLFFRDWEERRLFTVMFASYFELVTGRPLWGDGVKIHVKPKPGGRRKRAQG